MATEKKKKVSFDLKEKTLQEIKEFCTQKDMKLSDFFRAAVEEKIKRDKRYMTIFVLANGSIEKITIDTENYEVEVFEASELMKDAVNAKKEGTLKIKEGKEPLVDEKLKPLFENREKVKFFF